MYNKFYINVLCMTVFLFFIFTVCTPCTANAAVTTQPKLAGTFIQEGLMKDWDDAKWQSELRLLKDAGMEYIIIGAVAENDRSGEYTMLTNYPTSIPGCAMKPNHQDTVDLCLRNAELVGMKVFMGTNCRSDWFQNMAKDENWLYARMHESNLIADELWEKYKSKYPNAFYGWYWCYEVDNANYNTTEKRDRLANALNIILDHLDDANKRLPIMLCPFMNAKCSTPQDYENMWKYIFERTHFAEGDIFAPQDSVGAGGTNLDNFAEWFEALKRAVDSKPGLKLWSDLETFDHTDWTAATIDRIYIQMDRIKQYVENYVTFAYSHYQSPNNINEGYHATYLDYLKNGVVETNPPSQPQNLEAKVLPTGGILLDWDESTDNIGVCGYYIYRNGELIDKLQMRRKEKRPGTPGIDTHYVDLSVSALNLYNYEVRAFDFAGNISAAAGPIAVTANQPKIFANNISKGCSYTISPSADIEYPDTDNKELTDGVYADSSNYSDPAWQGWYNEPREVIVDLGDIKEVQQFIANCLYDRHGEDLEIFPPYKMEVSISEDGLTYIDVGELAIPHKISKGSYKLGLTLEQPINARYIKLISTPGGLPWTWPCWTFIDEFEVRNNDYSYIDLPNLISRGCSYTVTPQAHERYPDTSGKELTNGEYASSTSYLDSAWQGWDAGTREVVIDLGNNKKIQQVSGSFLYHPDYYMYTPRSATVWVSDDGVNFTEIGCLSGVPSKNQPERCKQYLTLTDAIEARYVKLTVTGGAWIFVDEIEIRNSFIDLPNIISKNCSYNVTPKAHIDYPDTGDKELTDGIFAKSTNYLDSAWQGWDAGTREIVIDLGSQKLMQQVTANFLNNPQYYMYPPGTATVWISNDAINYTKVGSLDSDNPGAELCTCKRYVTLKAPVQTRYVKLIVTGGAWIFVDEIEVRI